MTNSRIPVVHIITRLAIGGAQENTIMAVSLTNRQKFSSMIISGRERYPEGNLLNEIQEKDIVHFTNRFLVRPINPVLDFLSLILLIRQIRMLKGVVVHTHSSKAGILGRIAAKLAGSSVIIHTVHGWSYNEWMPKAKKRLYVILERLVEKWSDKLICVTEMDIKKGTKERIGKREKYVVIRSGFDVSTFREGTNSGEKTKKECGVPPGKKVVGTVGRFSMQKDLGTFVRVAEQVCKQRNDVVFVIVGDGELRSDIEDLIARLGLEERVLLLGARRNVERLFAIFDVFLLTSLWEGLPKVIPQAMASGVPVVATAVDGVKEVIQHKETGLLAEPKQVKQLVDHIVSILEDERISEKLVRNSFEVVDEFDAKLMVTKIQKLYEVELEAKLGIS
jgi:glycosyltransferase involved in cell wall biosynthesis